MFKNRRTGSILEGALISAAVVTVVIAFSVLLRKNWFAPGCHLTGDPQKDAEIENYKKNAQLVVTGKLMNIHGSFQQQDYDMVEGYGYFEIAVDKVERGMYHEKSLIFEIGWWSNVIPPEQYPSGIKKKYYTGDKLRAYLYYDSERLNGYYTPVAYYTIEPLS